VKTILEKGMKKEHEMLEKRRTSHIGTLSKIR